MRINYIDIGDPYPLPYRHICHDWAEGMSAADVSSVMAGWADQGYAGANVTTAQKNTEAQQAAETAAREAAAREAAARAAVESIQKNLPDDNMWKKSGTGPGTIAGSSIWSGKAGPGTPAIITTTPTPPTSPTSPPVSGPSPETYYGGERTDLNPTGKTVGTVTIEGKTVDPESPAGKKYIDEYDKARTAKETSETQQRITTIKTEELRQQTLLTLKQQNQLAHDFKITSGGKDISKATDAEIEAWLNSKVYDANGKLIHDKLLVEGSGVWTKEANDKYGLGGLGVDVTPGTPGYNVGTFHEGGSLYSKLGSAIRSYGASQGQPSSVTVVGTVKYRYEVPIFEKIKLNEAQDKGYVDSYGLITDEGQAAGYGNKGDRPIYLADMESNTTYIQKVSSSGKELRTIDTPYGNYVNEVVKSSFWVKPDGTLSEITFAEAVEKGYVKDNGQVTDEGVRQGFAKEIGQMANFAANINEFITYVREVPIITKTDLENIRAEEVKLTVLKEANPDSPETKAQEKKVNDWWGKHGDQLMQDLGLLKVAYAGDPLSEYKYGTDDHGQPMITWIDPVTKKSYALAENYIKSNPDEPYRYSSDGGKTWDTAMPQCSNNSCRLDFGSYLTARTVIDNYKAENDGKFPDAIVIESWKTEMPLPTEGESKEVITTPEQVKQAVEAVKNDLRSDLDSALVDDVPEDKDRINSIFENNPLVASILAGVSDDKLKELWSEEQISGIKQELKDVKVGADASIKSLDDYYNLPSTQRQVFDQKGSDALKSFIESNFKILEPYQLTVTKTTEQGMPFASHNILRALQDGEKDPEITKAINNIYSKDEIRSATLDAVIKEPTWDDIGKAFKEQGIFNLTKRIEPSVAIMGIGDWSEKGSGMKPTGGIPAIINYLSDMAGFYSSRLNDPNTLKYYYDAPTRPEFVEKEKALQEAVDKSNNDLLAIAGRNAILQSDVYRDSARALTMAVQGKNIIDSGIMTKEEYERTMKDASKKIAEREELLQTELERQQKEQIAKLLESGELQRRENQIAELKLKAEEYKAQGKDDVLIQAQIADAEHRVAAMIDPNYDFKKFNQEITKLVTNITSDIKGIEDPVQRGAAAGLFAALTYLSTVPVQMGSQVAEGLGTAFQSGKSLSPESQKALQEQGTLQIMQMGPGFGGFMAGMGKDIFRDPAFGIAQVVPLLFGPEAVLKGVGRGVIRTWEGLVPGRVGSPKTFAPLSLGLGPDIRVPTVKGMPPADSLAAVGRLQRVWSGVEESLLKNTGLTKMEEGGIAISTKRVGDAHDVVLTDKATGIVIQGRVSPMQRALSDGGKIWFNATPDAGTTMRSYTKEGGFVVEPQEGSRYRGMYVSPYANWGPMHWWGDAIDPAFNAIRYLPGQLKSIFDLDVAAMRDAKGFSVWDYLERGDKESARQLFEQLDQEGKLSKNHIYEVWKWNNDVKSPHLEIEAWFPTGFKLEAVDAPFFAKEKGVGTAVSYVRSPVESGPLKFNQKVPIYWWATPEAKAAGMGMPKLVDLYKNEGHTLLTALRELPYQRMRDVDLSAKTYTRNPWYDANPVIILKKLQEETKSTIDKLDGRIDLLAEKAAQIAKDKVQEQQRKPNMSDVEVSNFITEEIYRDAYQQALHEVIPDIDVMPSAYLNFSSPKVNEWVTKINDAYTQIDKINADTTLSRDVKESSVKRQRDEIGSYQQQMAGEYIQAFKEFVSRNSDKDGLVYGDVHGDLAELKNQLIANHVIDEKGNWIYGTGEVVSLGDLTDRGMMGKDVITFTKELQEQAKNSGGNHVVRTGNHDANLIGMSLIFDGLNKNQLASVKRFMEKEKGMDQASAINRMKKAGIPESDIRRIIYFNNILEGKFADVNYLSENPAVRQWMQDNPAIQLIDNELMLHADTPNFYYSRGKTIDEVNANVANELRTKEGAFKIYDDINKSSRGMDKEATAKMLAQYGGDRIIHGHSPTPSMKIEVYNDGKAVNLNTQTYQGGTDIKMFKFKEANISPIVRNIVSERMGDTPPLEPTPIPKSPISPQDITTISRDLTDRGGTLIVKLGEETVGRVDVAVRDDGVMITDINISKEYQGKGYGEQLQLAVQRLADESGKPLYAGILSPEGKSFLTALNEKGAIKLEEVKEGIAQIEGQPVTVSYKISKGEVTPPKESGKGLAGEEGYLDVSKFSPEFQNKAKEIREAFDARYQEMIEQGISKENMLKDPEYKRLGEEYWSLSGIEGLVRNADDFVQNIKWVTKDAKESAINTYNKAKDKLVAEKEFASWKFTQALNEFLYSYNKLREAKDVDTLPVYKEYLSLTQEVLSDLRKPFGEGKGKSSEIINDYVTARRLVADADKKAIQSIIDAGNLGIREKRALYNNRMREELDILLANLEGIKGTLKANTVKKLIKENRDSWDYVQKINQSSEYLRSAGADMLANMKELQNFHDSLYNYVELLKGENTILKAPDVLKDYEVIRPDVKPRIKDAVQGKLSSKEYGDLFKEAVEYVDNTKVSKTELDLVVKRYENYKKAVADILLDKEFDIKWNKSFNAYKEKVEALERLKAEKASAERIKEAEELVRKEEKPLRDIVETKSKDIRELRDYGEIPYKPEARSAYIPIALVRSDRLPTASRTEARALPKYDERVEKTPYESRTYVTTTEYREPGYYPTEYKTTGYPSYGGTTYKPTEYTVPPYKVPPVPPIITRSGPPVKGGKKRAEDLTDFEKESAIAWKQGIMFRMRYYPYRHEDMKNTRKPIDGVKYYEGPESAYKSVKVLYPGIVPADMTFEMGLFKTNFKTQSDKQGGTQIEVDFIERPEQAKHEQRLSKKEREEQGLPPAEPKKKRTVKKQKPVIEQAEEIVVAKQEEVEEQKKPATIMPIMPETPPMIMDSDMQPQRSYNDIKNGKKAEEKPIPEISTIWNM